MRFIVAIAALVLVGSPALADDRYALVDATGKVVGVTVWDGVARWAPPPGQTAVKDTTGRVDPGWTYQSGALTPPPAVPDVPKALPYSVSRMQMRVAMRRANLLVRFEQWVATRDAETQDIWNTISDLPRSAALVNDGATALGLSKPQVDQLFAQAMAVAP